MVTVGGRCHALSILKSLKYLHHIIQRPRQDIPAAGRDQVALEFLLVIALFALGRFHLDPDVLTLDYANDIGAARRAEAVKMLVGIREVDGIIEVVKNELEREIIEDGCLRRAFFHFDR